ncbi:MAG: Localization factor PodJS, partial [Caulobacteraceae bacterium]
MTAAGPWSVKGIDPKAREIAKDLARRSGMTLGEWLNQMIIEGGESEPPPFEAPPPSPPYAETRRRGLDELYREARSVRAAPPPTRFPEARPETRYAEPRSSDGPEVARVAQALSDLSLRMEAAEHRSTLAISGIDQSVMGVLSRLDDMERDQGSGHARLDGSVADVRAAQAQVADRLRRLEHEDSTRVEALKALESALGRIVGQMQQGQAGADQSRQALDELSKRVEQVEASAVEAASSYADAEKVETVLSRMAERLDQAETRTSAAVQSLQTSFAGLDARLRHTEARGPGLSGAEIERRFQTLAEELSQRVEASRNELAQRLRSAADGRLDRLEAVLREMRGQVDQAEQRSAQAIERISREVMRVAHGLGERVAATETQGQARAAQTEARIAAVESRSAAAVENLGGEVARIADVMETRMRQADGAQAQAMEKLGGEIARIAERLADRISSSDRRSAEAIDEVSDKVAKISERMDERQTRSVSELADRIRQSEERTAKLLEEARERLDQRLGGRIAAPAVEAPPRIATPAPAAMDCAAAFD